MQLWSTETVDGYGESQVEMCCNDGLEAVKDIREAWTKRPLGAEYIDKSKPYIREDINFHNVSCGVY
jgi:hypothetical protein